MNLAFFTLLSLAPAQHAGPRAPVDLLRDVVDAGPPPIAAREDLDAPDSAAKDAGPPVAIPNLTLQARVEPDPAPFGQPFKLIITIARDRGLRLELPGSIPDVDGAPRTGEPTRSVEDVIPPPQLADAGPPPARVRETIEIPFLALDTQDLKTPAFVLTAKDGATVEVPALTVHVHTDPDTATAPDGGPLPPGAVMLESAAPAIAYAVPDARPAVIAGAFVGAGGLYALVRFFARRRKARMPAAPAVPPPPPRPAHEVALERLDALLASGMLARGETAVFVERLMDEVLRDYIAARFTLPAGARTTRELVKELLGVAVVGLDVSLVEGLLEDADLVKFAKASIPADRAHAMATRVRALVMATRVAPPAASSSSSSSSSKESP